MGVDVAVDDTEEGPDWRVGGNKESERRGPVEPVAEVDVVKEARGLA
jgi:hypothetical protein